MMLVQDLVELPRAGGLVLCRRPLSGVLRWRHASAGGRVRILTLLRGKLPVWTVLLPVAPLQKNKHLHWNLKLISEHEDSGLQASGASPLKIQTPQTDTASHYLYYHMLINYNCVETCWSRVWSRTVPRPLLAWTFIVIKMYCHLLVWSPKSVKTIDSTGKGYKYGFLFLFFLTACFPSVLVFITNSYYV